MESLRSRPGALALRATIVADLPQEIRQRGAKVRVVDLLVPLQDEIVAPTLDYSIIRMRNAAR